MRKLPQDFLTGRAQLLARLLLASASMDGKALLNLLQQVKTCEESELVIGVDNQSSYTM